MNESKVRAPVFRPLKSHDFVVRLTVFSSISRSHDETDKSHDKQRHKLKRCNFWYNFIFGLLRRVLSVPFSFHQSVRCRALETQFMTILEDMFQITSPLPISRILITFLKWWKLLMNLINIYQTKSVVYYKQDTTTFS